MKVAVIGPQFPDSFAHNVVHCLREMHHDVVVQEGRRYKHNQGRYAAAFHRYLPKAFPALETGMHRRTIAEIAEQRPSLVLCTYDLFAPAVVTGLKKAAQCPVFCWFIDHPANLRSGNLFLCDYDAFFVKEPRLAHTLSEKLGLPAHYLPEACNPAWHRPVTPTVEQKNKYSCDIVAQGTAHPYRAKFFEGLLDFDVKIWGTPAPPTLRSPAKKFFQGTYVAGAEKAAAFACGKILVNSMYFAEQDGVNNTLFEAAGCGAFQICDERPTLHEFFTAGEEVITFRSRNDLVEKARHYLGRPDERKAVAERATRRAHREHTYEKRLTQLLKTVRLI